jgi:hypothetical protein
VSRDSPHISSLNAFTTNASPPKKASYSLPKRLGAAAFHTLAKTHLNAEIFSISLHKIDRRLYNLGTTPPNKTYTQKNRYSDSLCGIAKMDQQLSSLKSTGPFTSNPFFPTNSTSLRQTQAAFLYLAGASLEDIAKALEDKQPINPCTVLPKHYHQFLSVFNITVANTLPSHRECDYSIELKPGIILPFGLLYNMSVKEL